jgi:hypothetical protein
MQSTVDPNALMSALDQLEDKQSKVRETVKPDRARKSRFYADLRFSDTSETILNEEDEDYDAEELTATARETHLHEVQEMLKRQIKKDNQIQCYKDEQFIIRAPAAYFAVEKHPMKPDRLYRKDVFVWHPMLLCEIK